MSILINGMDMPEQGIHHGAIVITETVNCIIINGKPYNKCFSISEIPTPHGRLIDADRLIVALKNSVHENPSFLAPLITISQIEQQPTIIETEE